MKYIWIVGVRAVLVLTGLIKDKENILKGSSILKQHRAIVIAVLLVSIFTTGVTFFTPWRSTIADLTKEIKANTVVNCSKSMPHKVNEELERQNLLLQPVEKLTKYADVYCNCIVTKLAKKEEPWRDDSYDKIAIELSERLNVDPSQLDVDHCDEVAMADL